MDLTAHISRFAAFDHSGTKLHEILVTTSSPKAHLEWLEANWTFDLPVRWYQLDSASVPIRAGGGKF